MSKHECDPREAYIRILQDAWKQRPAAPDAIADEEEFVFADGVAASIGEALRYARARRRKAAGEDRDDEDRRIEWVESLTGLWMQRGRNAA